MSPARAFWAPLVASALAQVSACSLVLDDLEIPPCVDDERDCAAFNRKHGLDDGPDGECIIYQCRADGRGCELRARDRDDDGIADEKTCAKVLPGQLDCNDAKDGGESTSPDQEEVCDGQDNNCNGFIDEGALGPETLLAPSPISLELAAVTHVTHTSDASGDLLVAITNHDRGESATQLASRGIGFGTVPLTDPETRSCGGGDCKIAALGLAVSRDRLFAAGINIAGCASGQLRVAISNGPLSAPDMRWDGSCPACEAQGFATHKSALSGGVDVASGSSCSQVEAWLGASAPALALLTDDSERQGQGLALWRAGSANADGPLPLSALPLKLEGSAGDPTRVVRIEGPGVSARSQVLNEAAALGHDPAVILPWRGADEAGFFVAYDSEQGVELSFVPLSASGKAPNLADAVPFSIQSPGAREVALALGEPTPRSPLPHARLALVWRTSAPGGGTLLAARVAFDPRADPAFQLTSCAALPTTGATLSEPSLLYSPDGFANATRMSPGGLLVSWLERHALGSRMMAARLPDALSMPADACEAGRAASLVEPPFVLADAPSLSHTFTFSDRQAPLGYGFVTTQGSRRLNIGALVCR